MQNVTCKAKGVPQVKFDDIAVFEFFSYNDRLHLKTGPNTMMPLVTQRIETAPTVFLVRRVSNVDITYEVA